MARLVSRRSLLPQILVLAFLALSLAAPLGAASAGVYTQSAVTAWHCSAKTATIGRYCAISLLRLATQAIHRLRSLIRR